MIRKWQGEMMEKGFRPTYLKTIQNQLSAIMNYAVNFYELRSNPCRKAGSMGKSRAEESVIFFLFLSSQSNDTVFSMYHWDLFLHYSSFLGDLQNRYGKASEKNDYETKRVCYER